MRVEAVFKNYASSDSISNMKVRGLKGFSYIKCQNKTLKDYGERKDTCLIVQGQWKTFPSQIVNIVQLELLSDRECDGWKLEDHPASWNKMTPLLFVTFVSFSGV